MKQSWFWRFCIIATFISVITAFTQIHVIKTESDMDRLYSQLENRNGMLVVEIIEGTVVDTETGAGEDALGYYTGYSKNKYKNGEKVVSVFIYNPTNNATDDILWRFDF